MAIPTRCGPDGVTTVPPTTTSSTSIAGSRSGPGGGWQIESNQQVVEVGDRARGERAAGRPHARGGDRAPALVDELADGKVEDRLVLEADERGGAVEDLAGAVLVAGEEAAHDVDEDLREAEAGHRARGAGTQLLEQHDPAQAAEDGQLRVRSEQTADLGRRWLLLELHHAAFRGFAGQRGEELRAHPDAAAGGVVLDHDGQVDRLGDGEVVAAHRGVVGPREGWWGEHHRVGPECLGLASVGDGAIRGGVGPAPADGGAPMTPRMVMPSTPQPTTKSTSVAMLASSRSPFS